MAEGAAAPRLGLLRRSWPLLPALAFLGVFFLYPVVDFLALSFTTTKGDFTLAAYNRVLEGAGYMRVMGITFKISLMVTFFSIVLGYPVAYLLAAVDQKTRARLVVFVLIPFWTSFLVRTFALMILLAHEGPLQSAIRAVGLGDAGFKPIFSMTGVMIGTTQALMPMAILVMMSAMLGIDRDLLKAASTMGARRGQAFFRIYLPLSLPGVTAAALLTFITSLGFFITPALLGSPRESMIAQIILTQIQELLNWRLAGALSLVLLACALGIFAVYDRVANPRERARDPGAPVSALRRLRSALGRRLAAIPGWACDRVAEGWERLFPPRADRPPADRGGMALRVVAGTLIVFLVAPAFVVVPVSFTAGNFIALPPDGLSLRWYETYLGSRVWMNATGLSFLVGVVAALLTTLLGTAAAFVLTRQAFPGRRVVMALFISPLIVPRIVTAVALFYLFARLELVGTVTGLVIGHTVLALPFVVVTVMAILKSYDIRYDQAAATLGAGPLRTLRHVTLPLLKAGIVSAFLFAFVTSFDELTVALFISAGTVTTLPKAMWSDLILQMNPTLAAVSTVILVMATAIVLAAEAFQRRASRHRGASS